MDTYSAFVDWVANRSGAVLVLLATLPSAFFLKGGRLLGGGALAVFIGAAALILFGIEGLAGAVVVVIANTLLVSVAVLATWKRSTQIEERLESVISAIRDLEIAEERRQTFSARHRLPRGR